MSRCFQRTIYYNPKILFLRVNSQLRAHHFLSELGNVFSLVRHYLSTLNFSRHFLGHSLIVRSSCNSSQSAFVLNILNNLGPSTKAVISLFTPSPAPGRLHIEKFCGNGAGREPVTHQRGQMELLGLPWFLWTRWGWAQGNPRDF